MRLQLTTYAIIYGFCDTPMICIHDVIRLYSVSASKQELLSETH